VTLTEKPFENLMEEFNAVLLRHRLIAESQRTLEW